MRCSPVYSDISWLLLSFKQSHVLRFYLELLVKIRIIDRIHSLNVLLVLVVLRPREPARDEPLVLKLGVDQSNSYHQDVKRHTGPSV